MSPEVNLKKILIIDFGSQFTQLIARRVRELGVYSQIISHKKINNQLLETPNINGIILSGGPLNVYEVKKVKFNPNALALIIGISDYSKTSAQAIYADSDAKMFYDYSAYFAL